MQRATILLRCSLAGVVALALASAPAANAQAAANTTRTGSAARSNAANGSAASARAASAWDVPPEDYATTPYSPRDVRVVVSVAQRQLWVVTAYGDTLRSAPVSVASGRELEYAGHKWRFATPRGALTIKGKRTDPVWMPPDWHYAEVASQHGLKLRRLTGASVTLRDGSRLVVRDSVVGLVEPGDTTFLPLPVDEHIVFDSTLFIPPVSTHNRHLAGELGRFALDLGSGYMLHGTFDQSTIGLDTTHGCIRLADEDLEWVYRNIPVGTRVVVR